jgi:hypothetical protein
MNMRRRFLIGVGLLSLFAAGIGLGMFLHYKLQIGVAEAVARLARGVVGEDKPGPPAPPLEDWRYPGADEKSSTGGMSLEVNGQVVKPAPTYVVWVTPDGYDQVAAFYGGKGGFSQTSGVGITSSTRGESNVVVGDDQNPDRPGTLRPVHAVCLRRRCGSYDLVVFITRAQNEGHTHIVVLYEPKAVAPAAQQ